MFVSMTDPSHTLHQARLRLDRAVSTVRDTIELGELSDRDAVQRAITRIVIFANSVATSLQQSSGGNQAVCDAADLLWKLGESLGIEVDEGRDGQQDSGPC